MDNKRSRLVVYALCIYDSGREIVVYLYGGYGDTSKTDKTFNSSHAFFILKIY